MGKNYIRKKTEAKFELAKKLKDAGLTTKQIALVVERKPATVRNWNKFSTYEEFHNSLTKTKKKDVPQTRQENVEKAYTFFDEIIDRLDRIEQILKNPTII
jgi:hypothetical protein